MHKIASFLEIREKEKRYKCETKVNKHKICPHQCFVAGGGSIHDYANEYCDLSISYPGLFFDNDMTHVM